MFTLNEKQKFIYNEITILAWGASVQRAKLYNQNIPLEERGSDIFRKEILNFIEENLLSKYKATCSEADHVANIQSLVEFETRIGKKNTWTKWLQIWGSSKTLEFTAEIPLVFKTYSRATALPRR